MAANCMIGVVGIEEVLLLRRFDVRELGLRRLFDVGKLYLMLLICEGDGAG